MSNLHCPTTQYRLAEYEAEQHSVAQIQTLLARTVEGISFFLLLNDHQIGQLISKTDAEVQKIITTLTFEELMTSDRGVHVSRSLVNVVIDQQIGQQVGVDTVSDVLQSRCGSFCSTDDVMLYKVCYDECSYAYSRLIRRT